MINDYTHDAPYLHQESLGMQINISVSSMYIKQQLILEHGFSLTMSSSSCDHWRQHKSILNFNGCRCSDAKKCIEALATLIPAVLLVGIVLWLFIHYARDVWQNKVVGGKTYLRALNFSARMNMFMDTTAFYLVRFQSSALWRNNKNRPMQNSVLPMELQDLFISFCDNATLSSCSLVCLAWLPLCRRRMTFAIRSRHHAAGLGHLLRNPRETISPYLHRLLISSNSQSDDDFVQHKRVLRHLSLKGAPLQSVIVDRTWISTILLSQYFPNITSLRHRFSPERYWRPNLSSKAVYDLRNFLTVVPRFRQLRSLSFDVQWISLYIANPVLDELEGQSPEGPLPVTHLQITGYLEGLLLTRLEHRCTRLVSFDCETFWQGTQTHFAQEVAVANRILNYNRQTLLHLTLMISVDQSPMFDLSSLKSLKTVRLVLHGGQAAESSAVRILSTLDAPHMQRVVMSSYRDEALAELPDIDKILNDHFGLVNVTRYYYNLHKVTSLRQNL